MSGLCAWLRAEVRRAPLLYAVLLVIAVSFAAYGNSLQGGFHYDDSHHIVRNPFVRDLAYVPQFFTDPDLFSALPGHRMYRPVVMTSYALNYSWGGYRPLFWRLTALALHAFGAVGVLLTFRLLIRTFHNIPSGTATGAGLVAALFLALHPVFSETVNYASARSGLLATGFVLWALYLHLRAEQASRPWLRVAGWTLSLLCFLTALGSKEIAIVYPALLLAVVCLRGGGAAWRAVLPAACVALLYLGARHLLLNNAVIDFTAHARSVQHAEPGSGASRPVLFNLYTQARVLLMYLGLFAVPMGLTVDRYVRVSETPFEPGVLLGAATVCVMLVMAWRLRKTRPLTSLGLVWFLVALAPTSSIIPLNVIMNEHRLYLPGVGLAFVVADTWGHLRVEGVAARWARFALPAAACLLLASTWVRNTDWRDSQRLWAAAVEVSPRSHVAWNSLGVERRDGGDFEGAAEAFHKCLTLQPYSWNATFNLGTLHLWRGRESGDQALLAEARKWLERSLEVRPDATRSRWFLAETLWAQGHKEESRAAFGRLACESTRLFEMTRFPLARMEIDRGRLDGAEAYYREALHARNDPVAAHLGLAEVARLRGDRGGARQRALDAALARPHSPEPHTYLARLEPGTPRAVRHLFEAERRGFMPSPEERARILHGVAE